MAEIRCQPLLGEYAPEHGTDTLEREVNYAVQFLETCGAPIVDVRYGYGYHHVPKEYQMCSVMANQLSQFLAESQRDGYYEHGRGDLYFIVTSPLVTITLCHEYDIHVSGDPWALEHFSRRWKEYGLRVWSTKDLPKDPTLLPREMQSGLRCESK